MKILSVKNISGARQQGFTIIELVVVILLLGILTATALPRFMDVTDEAHTSVVDAVRGGMGTGAALFRAQYIATGEVLDTAVSEYGGGLLYPDDAGSGYPVGKANGELIGHADCLEIYQGLVSVGRPPATSVEFSADTGSLENSIEGAAANVDFVITGNAVDGSAGSPITGCNMYYVGQFKAGTGAAQQTIPYLTYTLATGAVLGGSTFTFLLPAI